MPDELKGRELDAAVDRALGFAVESEGWNMLRVYPAGQAPGSPRHLADGREAHYVPDWSLRIEVAWGLVDRLRKDGWLVIVKEMPDGFPFLAGDDWTRDPKILRRSVCELAWMPRRDTEDRLKGSGRHFAVGDSAAVAICRVFLKAKEAESA